MTIVFIQFNIHGTEGELIECYGKKIHLHVLNSEYKHWNVVGNSNRIWILKDKELKLREAMCFGVFAL